MQELIDSLTGLEIDVINALSKRMTVPQISKKTGLMDVEVNRAVSWLESKGLVDINRETKEVVRLTSLGEKYSIEGIPEKRFLSALAQKGELDLDEIKKIALLDSKEFGASMGILRKTGLISLSKKGAKITSLGKDFLKKKSDVEKTIEMLKEGKQAKDHELLKRGIISSDILTIKHVQAKKELYDLKKHIKNDKVIERITPETIKSGKWRGMRIRAYDMEQKVPKKYFGKKHPYLEFLESLKRKLVALGFKELGGPLIESSFWNCDALFMPQDHPARGIHDAFFIKKPKYSPVKNRFLENVRNAHENGIDGSRGWDIPFSEKIAGRNMLRSQGTAMSARMLGSPDLEIPGKYFGIARCFRPDITDRIHLSEFNQVEGIILGEELSIRKLFGVLKMFAIEVAGMTKFRIIPDYFPFTEPSAGLLAYKKGFGWIEFGGSGIFRPEVTKPFGIDVPVLAWGLGVDRLFMMKSGIDDIRDLFTTSLKKLRDNYADN